MLLKMTVKDLKELTFENYYVGIGFTKVDLLLFVEKEKHY